MKKINKSTLSYLAAYVDNGIFLMVPNVNSYYLQLSIAVKPQTLKTIKELSKSGIVHVSTQARGNKSYSYRIVSNEDFDFFLPKIEPYLIHKKEYVTLFMAMRKLLEQHLTKRKTDTDERIMARRAAIYKKYLFLREKDERINERLRKEFDRECQKEKTSSKKNTTFNPFKPAQLKNKSRGLPEPLSDEAFPCF